jgi:hypothetical protein
MANRDGAAPAPEPQGEAISVAPERRTNLAREEARQRRGNLFAAMVSGRAGRAHRFKAASEGLVLSDSKKKEASRRLGVTGLLAPTVLAW